MCSKSGVIICHVSFQLILVKDQWYCKTEKAQRYAAESFPRKIFMLSSNRDLKVGCQNPA